jgi:hypothetical protein
VQSMEGQLWQRCNWTLNALLVLAVVCILASAAWGLDTQHIVVEWTPEGKKLAMHRVAEWQPKEEMVVVPAGPFLMGSDKRVDPNAIKRRCRNEPCTWAGMKSISMK